MLDTKLKKSHKKTNLIIALIVLVPALILVCLYPAMERAMLDQREKELVWWTQMKEELEREEENRGNETAEVTTDEDQQYQLAGNFVNYLVEANYYQYAQLLQEEQQKEVDISVLEYYGWINDYFDLIAETPYYAEYGKRTEAAAVTTETADPQVLSMQSNAFPLSEENIKHIMNGEALTEPEKSLLKNQGYLGYVYMEYDSYGRLKNIRITAEDNLEYEKDAYRIAQSSMEQYKENVDYYDPDLVGPEADPMDVCPKDFRGIYLISKNSDGNGFVTAFDAESDFYRGDMIYHDGVYYDPMYFEGEMSYSPPEYYYLQTGAYWIVAGLAVVVMIAALILPFFKKLETGWEKLFSIPTEILCCVIAAEVFFAACMGLLMSSTTLDHIGYLIEQGHEFQLLSYTFSKEECYGIFLVVNFLGWVLAFFLEYICVAQIRQFFCGPKEYLKNRVLMIRFFRWIGRKCKAFWHYVTDINIGKGLHKSILKIVLVNLAAVLLLCCMWFVGAAGAVLYSILLYVQLKKYGEKIQKQYQSILNATGQMAEGDLHITLEEDLGIFAPLGKELESVQKGFAKAVAEEAKSQNMKSELITNVSHDLKTPLTAIITYVDLLKKPELTDEERNSYIETLDQKSQRLKVLIEDLFEVSKANSGNVTMHCMDVDIVNLLKEVRVELSDKIEQSNLDFRWNLPEEKVILSLDGQRTYRIFENILSNAIKYAMPFSRVYVDLKNEEQQVVITFRNMSAQELNFDAEHLTERFVRGDSSRNSEGSGLGLAIAKSFTELQNGQFDICVDGDLFKVMIRFFKK